MLGVRIGLGGVVCVRGDVGLWKKKGALVWEGGRRKKPQGQWVRVRCEVGELGAGRGLV